MYLRKLTKPIYWRPLLSLVASLGSKINTQEGGEQKHLDWLFSLPAELRYNFSPIAGSTLGYKHTDDTRGDPPSGGGTPLIPPSQGRRGGRGCYNNGGGGLSMISYYPDEKP